MKGQRFHRRLAFAFAGLRTIWRKEASFRTQLGAAIAALTGLAVIRPAAIWVALILAVIGLVLAAEAFNAAIEYLADAVHPKHHPLIGAAKDAAAGAVLVTSLMALGVAAAAAYSAFS